MIQGLKSLIVISTLAVLSFSSLLVAKYTDAFSDFESTFEAFKGLHQTENPVPNVSEALFDEYLLSSWSLSLIGVLMGSACFSNGGKRMILGILPIQGQVAVLCIWFLGGGMQDDDGDRAEGPVISSLSSLSA